MNSRAWHPLDDSSLISDWFITLLSSAVIGQMSISKVNNITTLRTLSYNDTCV